MEPSVLKRGKKERERINGKTEWKKTGGKNKTKTGVVVQTYNTRT